MDSSTFPLVAVLTVDHSAVDLETIEALYENVSDLLHTNTFTQPCGSALIALSSLMRQRAQPEELDRIRKHYETSEEEDVKLLDKPEQSVSACGRAPLTPPAPLSVTLCSPGSSTSCLRSRTSQAEPAASSSSRPTRTESPPSSASSTQSRPFVRYGRSEAAGSCGVGAVSPGLGAFCVSKALLQGDGVREVMGLVLALGNYMNGGSRTRGQADGFGLDILPKLKDVKSRASPESV